VVWRAIADVASHVDWMAEARSIELVRGRRNRVGAVYEVLTTLGPLRTVDVMEIVEWRPGRVMGIRHVGRVSGTGRFTLRRRRGGRTRFTWEETLTFPWTMAGPVGGAVGGWALKQVWRRNLRRLKAMVEGA
jgi:hypothetical protein